MTEALDYARRVDEIKIRTFGRNAPTAGSNFIISMALERAGWITALREYSNLKDDPKIIRDLQGIGNQLLNEESLVYAWYGPKISLFTTGLNNGFKLGKYLESLPPQSGAEDEQQAIEKLRAANDDLFAETRALSTYGVKSAIAPSFGTGSIHEWLVTDSLLEKAEYEGRTIHVDNTPAKYIEPSLASFAASASRFTSSKIEYEASNNPTQKASIVWAKSAEIVEDPSADMFFLRLGLDGHLRTVYGFDLREYFEHVGAGMYEYEQMRAEILSIYADLVTPVWVQELADHDVKVTRGDKGLPQLKSGEKPSLYDLVLARKKVIKTFKDDIVGELQDELEEHTEKVDEPKVKREMVKHTVIGHLRKIGDNHRASPEARRIAWEEDERLLPEFGWTWQKTHERGSLPNPSRGHKMRLTTPSAPKQAEHAENGTGEASYDTVLPSNGDIFTSEKLSVAELTELSAKRNGRKHKRKKK